jgi:hypothetical protein
MWKIETSMPTSVHLPSFVVNQDASRAEPGTVSICFVNAALEPVRARHLDVDTIIKELGLTPDVLRAPHTHAVDALKALKKKVGSLRVGREPECHLSLGTSHIELTDS